jgi:hypothetical protein
LIGHLGFLNQVSNQISLQVAHFDPESLAHFNPDLVAHFNPESLAHFNPESLAHFNPEYPGKMKKRILCYIFSKNLLLKTQKIELV